MKSAKLSRSEIESHVQEAEDELLLAQKSFEERRPRLREMMSMYAGHQWYQAVTSFETDTDADEPIPVYSYIPAIVDAAVSSTLQSMLSPDAPASYDGERERVRGEASRALMRSTLRNGIFGFEQLVRGVIASKIYGYAWFKTYWDTEVGKIVVGPEGDLEPQGDARVRYISPYDFWPDVWSTHQDALRHGYHLKFMSVKEAEETYPVDVFGKPTKGRFGGLGLFGSAFIEKQQIEDGLPPEVRSNGSDMALIVDRFDQRSRRLTAGRYVCFCPHGGLTLDVAPSPYSSFPFDQMLGEHILPNSINPLGVVYRVSDAQSDLNFQKSKVRDILNKFVNPPVFNPIGSGISADVLSTSAGKVIPYILGHKPELGQMAQIPEWVLREADAAINSMKDMSGYAQIPPGVPQPGMESGRAQAISEEIQNAARRVQQTLFKQTIASIFRKTLELQRDFYEEGRTVKIFGPNGEAMRKQFFRKDFDLEAEIEIDPFSGAPTSRALRFQERIEAYNAGWYDDANPGSKELRREMGLDTGNSVTEDPKWRARRHVREEHCAILDAADGIGDTELFAGDGLGVFPEDDHATHIEEDNPWMQTREFRDMPESFQALYRQHVAYHFAYLDQQAEPPMEEGAEGAAEPTEPGLESPPTGGRSAYAGPAEQGAAALNLTADSATAP